MTNLRWLRRTVGRSWDSGRSRARGSRSSQTLDPFDIIWGGPSSGGMDNSTATRRDDTAKRRDFEASGNEALRSILPRSSARGESPPNAGNREPVFDALMRSLAAAMSASYLSFAPGHPGGLYIPTNPVQRNILHELGYIFLQIVVKAALAAITQLGETCHCGCIIILELPRCNGIC